MTYGEDSFVCVCVFLERVRERERELVRLGWA